MTENEGDGVLSRQVGEPVPFEDALGGDDQIIPEGLNGVENAQIEGAGVNVDPAVKLMLLCIETHGFDVGCVQHRAYPPRGRFRRRPVPRKKRL